MHEQRKLFRSNKKYFYLVNDNCRTNALLMKYSYSDSDIEEFCKVA